MKGITNFNNGFAQHKLYNINKLVMKHRKWRIDTHIPILVITGLAAASLTVNAESETDSSLWFSFSPSARGSMKIDVGGSSYATLSTVGSLFNYSDRSYDDGYVNHDSS